ncbi:MAG: glycoside hydrolase [bacterium]|nr:glycoside hydrolase [bacterium]
MLRPSRMRFDSLLWSAVFGVSVVYGACVAISGSSLAGETVTLFQNGDGYNVFRIPATIQAANGDILVFCEAREGGDASAIDLVLRRSSDGGATWGPMDLVLDNDDFQDLYQEATVPITVGNPAPVVDLLDVENPGRIWLPFTVENDRVFVTYSDDHGQSWSPRREITESVKLEPWGWYATGPVHSIQLQSGPHRGRLVIPADHRIGIDGADQGDMGAQLILSDDHGQTWRLGAVDASYDDGLNANETTVVELADGRLYLSTRDQKGRAPGNRGAAFSIDGGESFVRPNNSSFAAFEPLLAPMDPPVVQGALLRVDLANGDQVNSLVLFSGPDEDGPSGAGRSDLRIRFSRDAAATWHDGALVHVGPAAYSDMVWLRPEHIGIVYEAGDRQNSRYDRIDFQRLSISEAMGINGASPE